MNLLESNVAIVNKRELKVVEYLLAIWLISLCWPKGLTYREGVFNHTFIQKLVAAKLISVPQDQFPIKNEFLVSPLYVEPRKTANFLERKLYGNLHQLSSVFGNVKYAKIQGLGADQIERLILSSVPVEVREKMRKFIRPVFFLAQKYQVDPLWIMAIIWTESGFSVEARSPKGAFGLMQLMPLTQNYLLQVAEQNGVTFEDEHKNRGWLYLEHYLGNNNVKHHHRYFFKNLGTKNIELGMLYLKELLDRFNDPVLATVAFNMGPTWVSGRLKQGLPIGKKNHYLNKVLGSYQLLSQNLAYL